MSAEQTAAQDPASKVEVDVSTPESVARWCRELSTTDAALLRAVQEVGPRIDKIKDYLGAGGMAADQADA
jgi:hypothetical protein